MRALAMLTASLAPTLLAAQPAVPARQGGEWAATCSACHSAPPGTPGAPPPLAGRPAADLRAALAGFAAGTREATVMAQIAKGLTPAQIDALAAWFAAQRP